VDVVEGTARAALPHMAAVLAARPPAFPSLRAALDWAKRSGAALPGARSRTAVPTPCPALHPKSPRRECLRAALPLSGQLLSRPRPGAVQGAWGGPDGASHGDARGRASAAGMSRSAEAAAVSLPGMLRRAPALDRCRWAWRTPLERTRPFWDGWCAPASWPAALHAARTPCARGAGRARAPSTPYADRRVRLWHCLERRKTAGGVRTCSAAKQRVGSPDRRDEAAASPHQCRRYEGLSELFLAARAPKLLLLAGTDRLDRPLTIGQMQGRFQLALLPQARAAAPSWHEG